VRNRKACELKVALETAGLQVFMLSAQFHDLLVALEQKLLHPSQLILQSCALSAASLRLGGEDKTLPSLVRLQALCSVCSGLRCHFQLILRLQKSFPQSCTLAVALCQALSQGLLFSFLSLSHQL